MISPFTPENKASVGMQYEFGLGKHGSITPRLDVAYTDQVYSSRGQRADESDPELLRWPTCA